MNTFICSNLYCKGLIVKGNLLNKYFRKLLSSHEMRDSTSLAQVLDSHTLHLYHYMLVFY